MLVPTCATSDASEAKGHAVKWQWPRGAKPSCATTLRFQGQFPCSYLSWWALLLSRAAQCLEALQCLARGTGFPSTGTQQNWLLCRALLG